MLKFRPSKRAEDSDEAIIRLVETSGKDQNVTLESFKDFSKAQHTNLVETNQQSITGTGKRIPIKLGHHSIETIKVK